MKFSYKTFVRAVVVLKRRKQNGNSKRKPQNESIMSTEAKKDSNEKKTVPGTDAKRSVKHKRNTPLEGDGALKTTSDESKSPAGKATGPQEAQAPKYESISGKVEGLEFAGGGLVEPAKEQEGCKGKNEGEQQQQNQQQQQQQQLSPDEISDYRRAAQQKSTEAVRGAEERYAKEKDAGERVKETLIVEHISGEEGQPYYREQHRKEERQGGLLQAIWDTILEIARMTKELLLGKDDPKSVCPW